MAEKKIAAKKATPKTEMTLEQQLAEKRAELSEQTKSLRAGELVNPRILGTTRKEIARILTKINNEREGK